MTRNRTCPRRLTQAVRALVPVVVLSGACTSPAVEGYQIQAPPEGFLYAAAQDAGGGPLAQRHAVARGTWLGDIRLDEPHSTLSVAQYAGALTQADADATRGAREARVGRSRYVVVGPLRAIAMRDRDAWGWTEERHDEYGRFRSMQVTAMVSYDTVSFVLEFDTEVPERMTEAHMDAVLASFGLGRTVVHWSAVNVVLAVAGLVAFLLARRMARRQPTSYGLWERQAAPTSPGPDSPSNPGTTS